jgi:hypothetical protein
MTPRDRRDPLGVCSAKRRAAALLREAQRLADSQPSTFPFPGTLDRIGVLIRAALEEMESAGGGQEQT